MSVFPFALRLTCYCWIAYFIFLNLTSHALPEQQHTSNFYRYLGENAPARSPIIKDVDLFINGDEDDDEELFGDDLDDDYLNITEVAGKGQFLGSPCDESCNPMLQHVYCDTDKGICDCENLHPVRLGPKKGCAKPKKLGEQCYYRLTCAFVDEHATCTQVQHNAVCDCEEGYHKVIMSKGGRKSFCARDLVIITTDLSTFLAIISGIAVFTGLICFVLKLFNRGRYIETPTHFTSAARVPPMYFSRETGIPSTLQERPPSRSSQRSNSGPLTCAYPRRPSSGVNRAPVAATSRAGAARAAAILLMSCHRQSIKGASKHRRALSDVAEGSTDGLGSRRPSLASVHSSASSAKSFSAKRLERERNEKEQRQALQELKLLRQREKESQEQVAPTPSPRTPHSTDELLPSVEEGKEATYNQVPSVSGVENTTLMTTSIALSNEITPVVTTPLFDRDIISCTSNEALKL